VQKIYQQKVAENPEIGTEGHHCTPHLFVSHKVLYSQQSYKIQYQTNNETVFSRYSSISSACIAKPWDNSNVRDENRRLSNSTYDVSLKLRRPSPAGISPVKKFIETLLQLKYSGKLK
jgi:hypothetical protein